MIKRIIPILVASATAFAIAAVTGASTTQAVLFACFCGAAFSAAALVRYFDE